MGTHPQLLGLAHAKHVFLVVDGGPRPPGVAAFHAVGDAQGVFVRRPFVVCGSSWECHGNGTRPTEPVDARRDLLLFVPLGMAIHPSETLPHETDRWRSGPAKVRIGLAHGDSYAARWPSTVSQHRIAPSAAVLAFTTHASGKCWVRLSACPRLFQ